MVSSAVAFRQDNAIDRPAALFSRAEVIFVTAIYGKSAGSIIPPY